MLSKVVVLLLIILINSVCAEDGPYELVWKDDRLVKRMVRLALRPLTANVLEARALSLDRFI